MPLSFAEVVESVHELDPESKRELLDLLRAWLIEERRAEILANAGSAQAEYEQGLAKRGSLADLMEGLYGKGDPC